MQGVEKEAESSASERMMVVNDETRQLIAWLDAVRTGITTKSEVRCQLVAWRVVLNCALLMSTCESTEDDPCGAITRDLISASLLGVRGLVDSFSRDQVDPVQSGLMDLPPGVKQSGYLRMVHKALIDVRGHDLSQLKGLHLIDLAGLMWSHGTCWPKGWFSDILSSSIEIDDARLYYFILPPSNPPPGRSLSSIAFQLQTPSSQI